MDQVNQYVFTITCTCGRVGVARSIHVHGVGQDHVRIILLQNWAVALNANVWTSYQHDSLESRIQFLI